MFDRRHNRLLGAVLLVGAILLLTLFFYGNQQSQAVYSGSYSQDSRARQTNGLADKQTVLSSQDTSVEDTLTDKGDNGPHRNLLQESSGTLFTIKSGKSTVFVDEHGRVAIPTADVIEKLNINELEELFYRYIENIHQSCVRMNHMGNENDGGYHICETYISDKPCLMYSFGNRKDFSFDDAVASTYGCEVHSFDPGDGQKDHKHSAKVTFHSLGIGGEDKTIKVNNQNWKIMSFGSIRQMLGHKDKMFEIVKIDTEAAEWDSLETMIKTGDIRDINLLIVEFHEWINPGNNGNTKAARKPAKFRRYLNILRGIYESGFRMYFFRMWPWCHYHDDNSVDRTACHEVHMVNINRNKFS